MFRNKEHGNRKNPNWGIKHQKEANKESRQARQNTQLDAVKRGTN